MYVVLYTFQVKAHKDGEFIKGWKGLTQLIYKHEGSLGSRLHKTSNHSYFAYAQWPDKTTFENSGGNLPVEADYFRSLMRDSCKSIDIIKKGVVVEDLLMKKKQDV